MKSIEITYRIECNGKSALRTIRRTSEDADIDDPELPEKLWKALREQKPDPVRQDFGV